MTTILEKQNVITEAFEPDAPAKAAEPDRFTARDLQSMRFPPPKWVVPGLLPEGLSILAGKPKLGKSWLCLDFSLAVAGNRYTLDRFCEAGDVLYIALEDTPRRLRNRTEKLLQSAKEWPSRLTFWLKVPRSDEGGLLEIRSWLERANNPRLVVIDVLQQFRSRKEGRSQYGADYNGLAEVRDLAKEFSCSILFVHHCRKGEVGGDGDAFETISGTLGLNGATDANLVLAAGHSGVTLHAQGRDLEESVELAVRFDRQTCRWTAQGDAGEVRRSGERREVLDVLKRATEAMTPADLAAEIEAKLPSLKVLLGRMVRDGEIVRTARGRYQHPGRHDLKRDDKVTDADPPGYLAALALKGNA